MKYETELWDRYDKKVKEEKFAEWLWFPLLVIAAASFVGALGKISFLKGFEPICVVICILSGFCLFYIMIESNAIEEETREELEKEGIRPES